MTPRSHVAPLMQPLDYLAGYPPHVLERVRALIAQGRLGAVLDAKYDERHAVRNNAQLYDYVQDLKERHLRRAVPLGKVLYDDRLQAVQDALGTHTATRGCTAAGSRPAARSASPRCSATRRPSS